MSMAKGILEQTHPLLRQRRVRLPWQTYVVMLVGARLNWLLAHGKKGWAADTQFIQLDIEPQESTATAPLLCESLAILHPDARYAGRIETKHIHDSTWCGAIF
ncbi:hypothetical protein ACLK2D_12475 [Escherichia coli]